jgi:hypothetical protein
MGWNSRCHALRLAGHASKMTHFAPKCERITTLQTSKRRKRAANEPQSIRYERGVREIAAKRPHAPAMNELTSTWERQSNDMALAAPPDAAAHCRLRVGRHFRRLFSSRNNFTSLLNLSLAFRFPFEILSPALQWRMVL